MCHCDTHLLFSTVLHMFEANHESYKAACPEVSSLIDKMDRLAPDDINRYHYPKIENHGCGGILPDCTIVDGGGKWGPIDLQIPGRRIYMPEEGGISDVLSTIREKIFGSNFNDLNKKVEKAADKEALAGLTPEERQKYEAEKKALESYERRQMTALCYQEHPEEPPATPTMDKVGKRAAEIEAEARQQVMAHMTPQERAQYEQEKRNCEKLPDWQDDDPRAETVHMYRPPEPGPMMRELEKRTAAAIQSHTYKDQEYAKLYEHQLT